MGVERSSADPDELVLSTGTASGFIHPSLHTTSNPTLLKAGYKHNVIPDTAEALIDIGPCPAKRMRCSPRCASSSATTSRSMVMHRDIGLENPFRGVRWSSRWSGPCNGTIQALPCCRTCSQVVPTTRRCRSCGIAGYGFARCSFPPTSTSPAMFHGVDERVPLDALVFGARCSTDLLLEY